MHDIKGCVAHDLLTMHPELTSAHTKSNLWARGFYVASVGRVDPDIIENYLNEHEGIEIEEVHNND